MAFALAELGPQAIFLTLGKHGAMVATQERAIGVPAQKVTVVDPQGAGAAFSAAMIHALLRDWPMDRALRFATRAGSLKVAQRGLLERSPQEN